MESTMKRLILTVHAEPAERGWVPNPTLPLSPAGVRAATAAGKVLAEYTIDLALVSPAVSAIQTWEAACLGGASVPRVEVVDALFGNHEVFVEQLVLSLPEEVSTVLLLADEMVISQLIDRLAAPFTSIEDRLGFMSIYVMKHKGEWCKIRHSARKERYKFIRAPRK